MMRPTPVKLDHNPAFLRAVDIMEKTHDHVFITGRAGTGKSTLLDYIITHTAKKTVVLAPTGVAALNVRGQTLHRFFGWPIDVTAERIRSKDIRPRRTAKVLQKLERLIIDEISMVRADIMDCVAAMLELHGPHPGTPFGGVQMVLVGDLYQLPPVVTRDDGDYFETTYDSPYFFSARCLQTTHFEKVELTKVYRQRDADFIELLNRIRNNTVTPDDLTHLNARVMPANAPPPKTKQDDLVITLTTTNAAADAVNEAHLHDLKGREYLQRAEISGDFSREYYPTATDLYFKIGAQIMMLNNDSKGRWVNGSMGVILNVATDDDGNDHLKVRLQDDPDPVDVYPFMWEVFKFKIDDGQIASEAVGTFTQYPFRLAWAVTIHKSQGKTFDHVIVDIGRGTFAAGQLYVALSRCTSFEGLWLKTPIKKHHVMTDPKIGHFMIADQTRAAAVRMPIDDKVTMINQAIAARQALQITYIKPDETTTTRTIDPLSVGPETYRGSEFLGVRAWCHERQDNRIFRVDRILEIAVIAKTAAKKAQK